MLQYGYVSSGFQDHSFEQMLGVLSRYGYDGVGITLDHVHLDPYHASPADLSRVRGRLDAASLVPAIETGARYYLDALRKHRPSLVSADAHGRRVRATYYERAVEIAHAIGAKVVSLWSGHTAPQVREEQAWRWLCDGLGPLCDRAESLGVRIAFEPEPGMFVETLDAYEELRTRFSHPALGLTIDVGHLAVTESAPYDVHIRRFEDDLVHVHLDDSRVGVHEHLPFGEGEIEFEPILGALRDIDYRGLALVELSRHSLVAPLLAQRSIVYLKSAERRAESGSPSREDGGS